MGLISSLEYYTGFYGWILSLNSKFVSRSLSRVCPYGCLSILLRWLPLGNMDQHMRPMALVEKRREGKILVTKSVEGMRALKLGIWEDLRWLRQLEEFL